MMKNYLFIFIVCIAVLGTIIFQLVKPNTKDIVYPDSYMITSENNFFDYQPNYECAAFSSAYLLRHYGYDDTGLALFETFPDKITSGDGVFPTGIVKFFKSREFNAEYITNASIEELKQEISKGAPVIVFIHVEADSESLHYTHYVPIVGYDEEYFYFAESLPYKVNVEEQSLPYNRKTDIETFKKLWKNIDGTWQNPYFKISLKNL